MSGAVPADPLSGRLTIGFKTTPVDVSRERLHVKPFETRAFVDAGAQHVILGMAPHLGAEVLESIAHEVAEPLAGELVGARS